MKTNIPKKRLARKTNAAAQAAGRAMIADLKELISTMKAGVPLESKYTVRTVEVPDEPGQYDAAAIRATRDLLGASQAVFGYLVGVSVKLVQAWEQGNRRPAIWARRLFDEMNRDPKHWRGMLKKAS
jgi:DNA-binding transcriptional regulator YiaG